MRVPRSSERRARGERAGLTKDQVIAAASRLVAEHGLERMSLRGVAAELGVAPNALYSHVADKHALVDAVLDETLGTVPNPSTNDPRRAVRMIMKGSYEALVQRPALASAFLTRQGSRGPEAVRLGMIMDDCLAQLGLARSAISAGRRNLIIFTIGHAAFATGWIADDQQPVSASRLRRDFTVGLDALLDGMVAEASKATPSQG